MGQTISRQGKRGTARLKRKKRSTINRLIIVSIKLALFLLFFYEKALSNITGLLVYGFTSKPAPDESTFVVDSGAAYAASDC